jgi:hypothetical protein
MAIRLKMGRLRGVEINLISPLLTILNAQNIKLIIIRTSAANSLAGRKTLIQ